MILSNILSRNNYNSNEWFQYSLCYYEATRVLNQEIIENGNNGRSLIPPLLNLYCHFLEISMKAIAIKHQLPIRKLDHNLKELFMSIRPRLIIVINKYQEKSEIVINPLTIYDVDFLSKFVNEIGIYHLKHNFRYPNFNFTTSDINLEPQEFTNTLVRIKCLLNSAFFDVFDVI